MVHNYLVTVEGSRKLYCSTVSRLLAVVVKRRSHVVLFPVTLLRTCLQNKEMNYLCEEILSNNHLTPQLKPLLSVASCVTP